jgi:hypothetical protein
MKIFITDETNINYDENFDFFIYGGLVICEKDILPLSKELIKIKNEFDLDKKRPIKWTNNKWKGKEPLNPEVHRKIKEKMMGLIAESDTKIIIYLSPNDFHHISEIKGFEIYTKPKICTKLGLL